MPSQDSILTLYILTVSPVVRDYLNGLVRPVCVAQPRVYNPDNAVNEGGEHLNTADLAWMAAALDFMVSD